jgi:uncharacterized membrane protein
MAGGRGKWAATTRHSRTDLGRQQCNTTDSTGFIFRTRIFSRFGDDWFALKAEAFARFFGTPLFLVAQTVIVGIWILVNVVGWWVFDVYPFILLNLAFSLQAAYAAPLILLAQTRQADRDKATAMADAQHREDLHQASEERQRLAAEQTALLVRMLEQNTVDRGIQGAGRAHREPDRRGA